jgi:hypothetical protein
MASSRGENFVHIFPSHPTGLSLVMYRGLPDGHLLWIRYRQSTEPSPDKLILFLRKWLRIADLDLRQTQVRCVQQSV